MLRNNTILLAGGIPLGLGYIHSSLEAQGAHVDSFILDEDIYIHSANININMIRNDLEEDLKKGAQFQRALGYVLSLLGDIDTHSTTTMTEVLNQLLDSQLYRSSLFFQDENVQQLLNIKRRRAANRHILKGFFPNSLPSIEEDAFAVLQEKINEKQPLLIGFQLVALFRHSTLRLIARIHDAYPDLPIVVGGHYATTMYSQLLKTYPYLIIVLGEAEETFLPLILGLSKKEALDNVQGLAFVQAENIIKTESRALIANLDQLPFPKHELALYQIKEFNVLWITTARGCPFNCCFCSCGTISRHTVRFRSIENVVQELEYIKARFPQVRHIVITDDTFLINNERVIAFCDEVLRRNLGFSFSCFARVKPLSAQMIKKMELAGFVSVEFGIDTGDAQILENVNKQISLADITKAVKLFQHSTISVSSNFIVGLPGETPKTIRRTGLFVQQLQRIKYMKISESQIHMAVAYPGTRLFESMCMAGLLDASSWMKETSAVLFYTQEHPVQKLFEMREELMAYVCIDRFFLIKGFCYQLPVILFSRDRYKILKSLLKKTWQILLK